MLKQRGTWILSFVMAVMILAACGGHPPKPTPTPTPTPAPAAQAKSTTSPIPGMHVFSSTITKTIAFNWQLVPSVFAQNNTITLSQSWNGACNLAPVGQPQRASFLVYGLGQLNAPDCNRVWSFDNDGSSAAAGAQIGQLVVGNGSLTNLVAYSSQGTNIIGTGGVPVHVWVKRAGSVVDTGLTCNLPVGSGFQKCTSIVVFPVLDGDLVVATASVSGTDTLVGLNVVFTK